MLTSSTGSSSHSSRETPTSALRLAPATNSRRYETRFTDRPVRASVLENLVSVVYWFPFYFTFKFVFLLWLSLPTFRYGLLRFCCMAGSTCFSWGIHVPRLLLTRCHSCYRRGADIVFRSFLAPMLGRYFQGGGSTASGLRAKADAAHT